ncbi:hypothetical protein OAE29_07575 [Octadecabacter sp.]|nr:hypothetical protein [Octadecabacter sp.]
MVDDTTLMLSGAAQMNVGYANGSITIEGNDDMRGALTGDLYVYAENDGDDGVGDTLVVNTGTDSTYIDAADADDIVDIDAEVMADGTTLQLSGAANMDVDHVNASIVIEADGEDGDILTGTLNIVADDDGGEDVLTVFTGLNDTTIDAADEDDIVDISATKMVDDTTLTLSGAAEMTVDNTNGSITIEGNDDTLGALTGELYIVADDGGGEDGDLLVVNTGTNNTYIDTADGEDIVEIDVQAMADDAALRLSGEADMDVENANGSIFIMADGVDGEDGPLFGTLNIVAYDDGGEDGDTLTVFTGTNDTTIDAADEHDVVNINVDAMEDGHALFLSGAADMDVDNANGSIAIVANGGEDGDPLTGTLNIVAYDDGGEDGDSLTVVTGTNDTTIDAADEHDFGYVYAEHLADDELLTLRGAADFAVYDLAGDINAGGDPDADPSILALSGSIDVRMADGADSAIVGGSSQLDIVRSSDMGDTLRLTAIETVFGGAGDDQITITDDNLETIKMFAGNDTLTFEDGSALDASVYLSGGDNTADGQDVVNVNVDTELDFLLTSEFSGIEKLNLVDDESQDGLDATITLDGGFDNGGAITFDASTFNAGEVLTFDASSVVFGNEILVIGGEGDDVITTASQDVDRGLMTLDLTSGGQDTVVINNDGWNGEGLTLTTAGADMSIENGDWGTLAPPLNALEHGVEIDGFTGGAGGDRLDIVFSSGVSSNGSIEEGYVLGTGDPIDKSTGTVIELTSVDYTINLDNASITLQDIASDLSAGGDGDAMVDLSDGNYTVVIYSSQVASGDDMADAYLFNIRVDGGDGLDFNISGDPTSPNGQEDNDMIEYVGVIREVGADILVGENFI